MRKSHRTIDTLKASATGWFFYHPLELARKLNLYPPGASLDPTLVTSGGVRPTCASGGFASLTGAAPGSGSLAAASECGAFESATPEINVAPCPHLAAHPS